MIISGAQRWLAGVRWQSRAELFAALYRQVYPAWLDPRVPDKLAKLADKIGRKP